MEVNNIMVYIDNLLQGNSDKGMRGYFKGSDI